MKQWFSELSISFKTVVVSLIAVILAVLALSFGYFIKQPDLPNGVIAGGGLGAISYLLLGIAEKLDKKRGQPVWTIVFTIVRFILIAALIVLSALWQFKFGLKVMNVFAVLGGYIISLIVYIIVSLLEKKNV